MTRPSLAGWLWRGYVRRHWPVLLAGAAFMAVEGAMLGLLSYLIQPMFDRIFVKGDAAAIPLVGGAIFAVFTARAIAGFLSRLLMAQVGQEVSGQLQHDMVGHLLTLDSAYFTANPPGMLIERVRGDTLAASTIWGTVFGAIGRDGVGLVSLLAVALWIDWLWTLIAIAGAPVLLVPIGLLQRWVRRSTRASRGSAAQLSTRLDEMFHGITTIKLSGTEAREAGRFGEVVRRFVGASVRAEAGQAGIPALMDIVAGIGFLGVLFYGGSQIIAGEKSVGEFMSFFTAMALVFEPLRRLGNVSGAWAAARASLERLQEIFALRPTILSPASPATLTLPAAEADIRFESVNFAYGDQTVLRGLSFTARAGETTAIVGPSGAGKSTLFLLLARLIEARSGRVTIGGTPVETMDLGELRGLFSVVTQDALLFDETLRDNILMGAPDVSPERLASAVEAAHVADFLPRLSAGLDTPAGPRGSGLSGGQRQRVAIARAILRNRPILLLDEATSALDAASEIAVQDALERLSAGHTTLVIAHRLATVRDADKIVVMDQGQVVEEGRHADLLASGGLYARLYQMQFEGT